MAASLRLGRGRDDDVAALYKEAVLRDGLADAIRTRSNSLLIRLADPRIESHGAGISETRGMRRPRPRRS